MAEIYLNDIAHGRSGDKGDTSNVCVYARKPEYYKIIEREVTPEKLKAYFGDMVKGEITRYMYGVDYVPADLQMAAQEAARSEARPTVSKWLNICFNYDPVGRKYVFSTTRTAALVIIFGAVVFVMVLVLKGRRRKGKTEEQA